MMSIIEEVLMKAEKRCAPDIWPKSVRLNSALRSTFVSTVVETVVPQASEPTESGFAEKWGSKMYDMIYTPEVLAAMKACPPWMFKPTDYIYVCMGPLNRNSVVLKFKCPMSGSLGIEQENDTHEYATHNRDVGLPWLPEDHEAVIEFRNVSKQREDWRIKRRNLESQLQKIVGACNTSHQVFYAWPGAIEYATKCFPYTAPAAPQKGGKSEISAEELDLGIMFAKTTVTALKQA